VDLVMLDVMMPGMDGIEVCGYIRNQLNMLTLPIIAVSALTDRESRVRAKEAGADDFFTKPIDGLELLVRIPHLLRLSAQREELEKRAEVLEQELAVVTSKLLRMERLSTVSALASGVGHELRRLSGVYQGALQALHAAPREDGHAEQLSRLDAATSQLAQHATRLLRFGELSDSEDALPLLNEVVEGVVDLLRHSGRFNHVQIATELPAQGTLVNIRRTQLEQVLLNLVVNAGDAVGETRDRPPTITLRVSLQDGSSRARVMVSDNGCGIRAEDLPRVFDPYFTTKPADRAAGLGLTFVRHVCESVGGRVVITSMRGEGTTVAVDLPAVGQRSAAMRESLRP
jgi:signal transduction histidine kinase